MTGAGKSILGWSAAAALGTAALYQGLVTRSYAVETRKWARGKRLRFAVVADLHNTSFGSGQARLLGMVERLEPDMLLLPGDILTDNSGPQNAFSFLRGAAGIAPTYYALGNHEYRIPRMERALEAVERCGVRLLRNARVSVQTKAGPLLLAGCEDRERAKRLEPGYDNVAAMRAAFDRMAGEEAYTLLLAHRPEPWEMYAPLGFDLVVSGHAHGGQIRLPGVNGLYAPDQGLFPHHAGGLYRRGSSHHLVSRGVVVYRYLPRGFNLPEVVALDVVGSGSSI